MHFLLGSRLTGRWAFVIGAACLVFHGAARPCQSALTFDLTAAAGTPPQVIGAFDEAARLWSTLLEDEITVRLSVSFESIAEPGVLAFASSAELTTNYRSVRDALTADAKTTDDASAAAHFLPGNNLSMLINYTANNPNGAGSPIPYLDNTGLNTSTIRLTRANAKALGLAPATSGVSDGSITFDSGGSWDFDRSNGISFGATDFVGAAAHEIGHALGFTSGVDVLDQNSPGSGGSFLNDNSLREVTAPDLFRFSFGSVTEGTGVIDWTAGTADKYFSVDGGETKLVSFATGDVHGDRRQASHWKDNRRIGLMDPTIAPREFGAISESDVRLFDVIGWDRNFNKTWNATRGGMFDDIENWIGGVPDSPHAALFDVPGVYVVSFNGTSAASARLLVTDGSVNFNLGGATYTVNDPTESIVVGDAAGQTAALTIRSGSLVAATASIASAAGSSGQMTVSGNSADWTLTGNLYVGGDAAGAGGDGTLVARTSGSIFVADTLRVWDTGSLLLDNGFVATPLLELAGGLLSGTGQISGPAETATLLINNGRVAPGATIGSIEVDGDYVQDSAGSLILDIAGLTAGTQFDQLQILGAATLAGALEVTLTAGFQPRAGDRFALLSFDTRSGMFDSLSLPSLDEGLTWGLDYALGEFALITVGPLSGDTDGDGDVDIDDLNNVRNNFGGTGMPVLGDTDSDGDVDIDDLNNVRNNFGAAGAPVPEPATVWLALWGAIMVVRPSLVRRPVRCWHADC